MQSGNFQGDQEHPWQCKEALQITPICHLTVLLLEDSWLALTGLSIGSLVRNDCSDCPLKACQSQRHAAAAAAAMIANCGLALAAPLSDAAFLKIAINSKHDHWHAWTNLLAAANEPTAAAA